MKTFFKILGLVLLVLIIGLLFWFHTNLKDRHPGYKADLTILDAKPNPLNVGFAAFPITPEVPDKWIDKNKDAEYHPEDGDTFTDGNGNGVFDGVWIAGFGNSRAANGIHDDTWARTMVIDDGKTRLAIVVLDAIGFMNDDVIDIRSRIPKEAGITYAIISSTHTHEGPDLLGLWGDSHFKSGINKKYMEYVKTQTVKSVLEAVKKIRPARLEVSQDLTGAISLVVKTVFIPIKNVMFELGTTLGVLNRGTTGWMKMRSEVSVFNIGPLSFATLPGEVYPEILNGGIEAPEGQDYKIAPVEVPAVRDMMQGKYKFVFGLANDEIGYIVPKSQWDEKAPFTYKKDGAPYGEENSTGPETAPILHKSLKEMLTILNGK